MKKRLSLALAVLALVGCGSDPGTPQPEQEVPRARLDIKSCSGAWRLVFSPPQEQATPLTEELRWHDQRLYFRQKLALKPGIRSLPAAGGAPSLLYEGLSRGFWIEDQRLLVLDDAELFALPLEGGPTQVALRGPKIAEREYLTQRWVLDRDALYWVRAEPVQQGATPWSVWRARRDGGGEEQLAVLPLMSGGGIIEELLPAGDQLVAISSSGERAWAVPRSGGAARALTPPAGERPGVVGVGDDGTALWRYFGNSSAGGMERPGYLLSRGRTDGSAPEPFWADKPPEVYPLAAWWREGGGWFVSAWETGTDEALHTTLWAVTAQGKATRLACDPEVQSRVLKAAVAPDGLYGIINYTNNHWAILGVAAPGAP